MEVVTASEPPSEGKGDEKWEGGEGGKREEWRREGPERSRKEGRREGRQGK